MVSVGFIGYGYVLETCRKLCDKLGYSNEHYHGFEDIDCEVLFALRFKKIIPAWVFENVPTVVIHFGKLPHYRGWYPINQALKYGEKEIGITMFYVDEGIDTGDIIEQQVISIRRQETVDDIYQRCNLMALAMFGNEIKSILEGTAKRTKQPPEGSYFKREDLKTQGVV